MRSSVAATKMITLKLDTHYERMSCNERGYVGGLWVVGTTACKVDLASDLWDH